MTTPTREQIAQALSTIEKARPYLQAALDKMGNEYEFEDIKDQLMSGDKQLWLGKAFAAVTEIILYPRKKVVLVHLAGGDMQELIDTIPELEEFARIVEADGIEIVGRKGWSKILGNHGFSESAVHLYKGVSDGQE